MIKGRSVMVLAIFFVFFFCLQVACFVLIFLIWLYLITNYLTIKFVRCHVLLIITQHLALKVDQVNILHGEVNRPDISLWYQQCNLWSFMLHKYFEICENLHWIWICNWQVCQWRSRRTNLYVIISLDL